MQVDTNALVSATDLNRNSGQLVSRAACGERLVVLNQNRPVAAIVSFEDLRRLEALETNCSVPDRLGGARKSLGELVASKRALRRPGYTTVGETAAGEVVELRLACNTWVVGCAGSGLSVILSAFINGAAWTEGTAAHLALATTSLASPVSSHDTGRGAPPIVAIATDVAHDADRGDDFIRAVQAELRQRKALVQQHGLGSIEEYRDAHPSEAAEVADLIVVVERGSETLSDAWSAFVEAIIAEGGALSVYVWIFEQSARLGLAVRGYEFPQSCALKVLAAADARRVVGSDVPKRLARPGDACLRFAGKPDLATMMFRARPDDDGLCRFCVAPPDNDGATRFALHPTLAWQPDGDEAGHGD